MEDDALKKNTDCVYFLASPLTCKKGNDCEFRHSESARLNPRDCRYWLTGSCLNWDCPFRHPPLEGRATVALPGSQGPGGAAASNKSRTPCYFFQQGFCAKGDKCPFMHGTPSSVANFKTTAAAASPSSTAASQRTSTPKAAGAGASAAAAGAAAATAPGTETDEKESENHRASNGGDAWAAAPAPAPGSTQAASLETGAEMMRASHAAGGGAGVQPQQQQQRQATSQKEGRATQNGVVPRGRAEGGGPPPPVVVGVSSTSTSAGGGLGVGVVGSRLRGSLRGQVQGQVQQQQQPSTASAGPPLGGDGSSADNNRVVTRNGMDQQPDEWWEESSPGFDVLVDDGPEHDEQSRYLDDPDFQSAVDTGLLDSSGTVGAGIAGNNRARGGASRGSMRMAPERNLDHHPYDYDYAMSYDPHYDGAGGGGDYGGYDYNQQVGYDAPGGGGAYDRSGHQRASGYSERAAAEEMLARDRMGLPMDVDMRLGGGGVRGGQQQQGRIVKRRRADGGGQHHVSEGHSRRQRTEMPLDEYQQQQHYHHQRLQEDQQKQHELQLRQQLFLQQGMRSNSSRRGGSGSGGQGKVGSEPNVIARRALHDIASDGPAGSGSDRGGVAQKGSFKGGRSLSEQGRLGSKDVDIHSRLSKGMDSYGEAAAAAESRGFSGDIEGNNNSNRKSEKDVKKDPSAFAGPKSLAQIRAEKRKVAAAEDPAAAAAVSSKPGENLDGVRKLSIQARGGGTAALRSQTSAQHQDVTSLEVLPMDERKARREQAVAAGQESKKIPSFEGPKSLSAILREKRRAESEMESRPAAAADLTSDSSAAAAADRLHRLSPATRSVAVASRVEAVSNSSSGEGRLDDVGYVDVEDGELFSNDESGRARAEEEEPTAYSSGRQGRQQRQSHNSEVVGMDESGSVPPISRRDDSSSWREDYDDGAIALASGEERDKEEHMTVKDRSNGVEVEGEGEGDGEGERNEDEVDYGNDAQDFEDDGREDIIGGGPDQGEDAYGLHGEEEVDDDGEGEEEEEDDFAKKLGGFFS